MYTYYFIPGLISDYRAFKYLRDEMKIQKYRFLHWITPQRRESLRSYANRLSAQIAPRDKPAFIGVSLGGLIAIELASIYQDAPLALIASVKCKKEVPPYYQWFKNAYLESWVPIRFIQQLLVKLKPPKSHASQDHFELFREMLFETNPIFMRWALSIIANWEQKHPPKHYVHVHGTIDRLFPIKYISGHHTIEGGQHFMLVDKAKEIAKVLTDWQSKIEKSR